MHLQLSRCESFAACHLPPLFASSPSLPKASSTQCSGTSPKRDDLLPPSLRQNSKAAVALPAIAIVFDVFARFAFGAIRSLQHRKSSNKTDLLPAFNFDHLMERTTQFVVVIFGEFVILSSYTARGAEIGAHEEFGRSALSIIIALSLLW